MYFLQYTFISSFSLMWENSKIFHWYDSNNSYFLSILPSFFQLYSLIISFLESSWYHLLLMLLGNASLLHGGLSLSSKFYISKCMCERLFFWLADLKNVNHTICWYIISSIRMLLCSQYFLFLSIYFIWCLCFHIRIIDMAIKLPETYSRKSRFSWFYDTF